jgi:hypothetical protein
MTTDRRRRLAISLVVAAAALAGGVAYATIPDANNVYSACMLKGVGQIRLIDKALPTTNLMSHCTDKETEVSWNQTGPAGAPGAPGAKGDRGEPGNLALAGRSCADGEFVTGFDASGDLVCATPGDGSGGGGGGGGGQLSDILVSPAQLDFPATPVGGFSDAAFVTLTNRNPVDVGVAFRFTGDNFADFVVGDSCLTVPAEETCEMSIRFMPTGVGTRRALMTIQGPNGQNVLVPLSGIGTG